ncbi:hypothetical protein JW960_01170 [candidate division KSB1 bacterium]|nr:hypothetical protein [candidate division KSB1 bacterium]
MRQSLEAYESHSLFIWLTKTEINAFVQWIRDNRVLDFKSTYPQPEIKTYG